MKRVYDSSLARKHEQFNKVSRSAAGQSTIDIRCPFCNMITTAHIWSLAGGGRRCRNETCGAIHHYRDHSWPLKKETA